MCGKTVFWPNHPSTRQLNALRERLPRTAAWFRRHTRLTVAEFADAAPPRVAREPVQLIRLFGGRDGSSAPIELNLRWKRSQYRGIRAGCFRIRESPCAALSPNHPTPSRRDHVVGEGAQGRRQLNVWHWEEL